MEKKLINLIIIQVIIIFSFFTTIACGNENRHINIYVSEEKIQNSRSEEKPDKGEGEDNVFIPTQPFLDLVIVGLAEGSLNVLSREGNIEKDNFDDGFNSDGRISIYLHGRVMGKYGITASYDTEDPFRDRLFENLDPDRFYPIYGDGSSYYRNCQSKNRLYLRVDVDKSYLMYGDFATGFTGTDFSSYNRTFPGIKGHYENDNVNITMTGAKANQIFKRDEISGNGLSGIFYLKEKEIIEGSEKISIETRDKDIPTLVINSQVKIRNKDYTIDYEKGSILFKEPVPIVDEYENPLYIIVLYEVPGNEEITSLGLRGDIKLNENISTGLTYINESSAQDLQLYGIHSNVKINDRLSIYGEYASSRSSYGSDNAGKFEFTFNPLDNIGINGFYRKEGKNFYNPSGSVIERGTTHYGINGKLLFSENDLLTLGYIKGENELLQSSAQKAQLLYRKNYNILQFHMGYQYKDIYSPSLTYNSNITDIGVKASIVKNFSVFANQQFEWLKDSKKPQTVTNYKTTIGSEYLFENGVIGYLKQEFLRGDEINENQTLIGFTSPIGLGENTQFYTQYSLGGVMNGKNNQASIGLNTKVNITENILARLNYQKFLGTNKDEPIETIGGAMEFLGSESLKGTIRYEIKNQKDNREKLITFYGDGKINDNIGFIGRYTYSELDDFTQNDFTRIDSHLTIGFAFRPEWSNNFNLLGRYDLRRYRDNTGQAEITDSLIHFASLEGTADITDSISIYGKYAYKSEEDKISGLINTMDLFSGRLTFKFNDRLSLYGEARYLRYIDRGEKNLASIIAADYLLWENWMIEGGYVFKKYEELNIYNKNIQSQGPFIKLLLKY